MLIYFIVIVGVGIGLIASLPLRGLLRMVFYIGIATLSMVFGVLLSLGDTPLLMKYSYVLNEFTIPIVVTIVVVTSSLLIERACHGIRFKEKS